MISLKNASCRFAWARYLHCLAGNAEFRANRESLAKVYVFGEIGLNNTGRESQAGRMLCSRRVR